MIQVEGAQPPWGRCYPEEVVFGEARPEELANDLSPSKASLMECGLRFV